MLIGKTGEALVFVQNRIQGQPIGRRYIGPLTEREPEMRAAYDKVKQYIGGSGLLHRLRNEQIFHNPVDADVEAAFQRMDPAEDWALYTSVARHTTVAAMSHDVRLRALLLAVGDDPLKAVVDLRDEVLDASNALLTFFERLIPEMLQGADAVVGHSPVFQITDELESAREFKIPAVFR